jgi:hypothetical protein
VGTTVIVGYQPPRPYRGVVNREIIEVRDTGCQCQPPGADSNNIVRGNKKRKEEADVIVID